MNQLQTWFPIIHRKAIRRAAFRSLPHLKGAIQRFIDSWNARKHPFAWVKTADQILAGANHQPISDVLPYSGTLAQSAVRADSTLGRSCFSPPSDNCEPAPEDSPEPLLNFPDMLVG